MKSEKVLAELPIPAKEKVARWTFYGGIAAVGVVAVNVFMPFINKALALLLNGMFTVVQLGLIAAATCFGAFAIMTLWPVFKKVVESVANKATWALFEYDPITPMQLWLKEVRRDGDQLEEEYQNVHAVISQNEQTVQDNLKAAETGDKKFATAVKQFGHDSPEAKMMSLEPGTLRETAERIRASTKTLYLVRDTLKEVVDATAFMEKKAELDVAAFQQEFAAAQSIESATNSATRVLRGRSERKQNALMAQKIIHDKYAGSFGRLRSLRELSQELITSVSMSKGMHYQEALERLRSESKFITGSTSSPSSPQLEAVLRKDEKGMSFYEVQK